MKEILNKFEELEEVIKKTNEYQRCPDYCNGCVQCYFWKRFDYLKRKFMNDALSETESKK